MPSDREIVRWVAEKVMGWQVFKSGRGSWWARDKADTYEERDIMLESLHPWDEMPIWDPLTSIADAFEVQAAILAQGPKIRREYTRALNLIAWDPADAQDGRDWAMISATARQRTLAAYRAMGGQE